MNSAPTPTANPVDQLLQAAAADLRDGRVASAKARYQALLGALPEHPQILVTLGNLSLMLGDPQEGISWLDRSLRAQPSQAGALAARAVALSQLGRLPEALSDLDRAIGLAPGFAEAYSDRALVLEKLGRNAESLADLEHAIALKPDLVPARYGLGNAYLAAGKAQLARDCYDRVLHLAPNHAEAWCSRGVAMAALKETDAAIESYDRAISLRPGYWEAHYNRGLALQAQGKLEGALASFDDSLRLRGDVPEVLVSRGSLLQRLGRNEEALTDFDQSIALRPDHAEAHNNRGTVLRGRQRYEEALACFERSIALRPNWAVPYNNRGSVLEDLGRFREALESFDRAVALGGGYSDMHANRGSVLMHLGEWAAARQSLERALEIHPDSAMARWNKALLLLTTGEFGEGWELYESRWQTVLKGRSRPFGQPLWTGSEPLQGRTLLVHAEQGLGDVIQMCRYVPILAAEANVVLEVPGTLARLLRSLSGDTGRIRMVEAGMPPPDFDLHCPIMSLPLALRTKLETIPSQTPYLAAPPEKMEVWQQRLGPRTVPRVGLVWSGSRDHAMDRFRSLALADLAPLLRCPVEFHGLQVDIREHDLPLVLSSGLIDHSREIEDFSDTAALAAQLDLVISVDTSVAHLAGALGRPVWILLASAADFRWMTGRADSPWYSTARLFRQSKLGDWTDVLAAVSRELEQMPSKAP